MDWMERVGWRERVAQRQKREKEKTANAHAPRGRRLPPDHAGRAARSCAVDRTLCPRQPPAGVIVSVLTAATSNAARDHRPGRAPIHPVRRVLPGRPPGLSGRPVPGRPRPGRFRRRQKIGGGPGGPEAGPASRGQARRGRRSGRPVGLAGLLRPEAHAVAVAGRACAALRWHGAGRCGVGPFRLVRGWRKRPPGRCQVSKARRFRDSSRALGHASGAGRYRPRGGGLVGWGTPCGAAVVGRGRCQTAD